MSISVCMALSAVFYSINSSDNSPFLLSLFFQSYFCLIFSAVGPSDRLFCCGPSDLVCSILCSSNNVSSGVGPSRRFRRVCEHLQSLMASPRGENNRKISTDSTVSYCSELVPASYCSPAKENGDAEVSTMWRYLTGDVFSVSC